jgi:D-alanyl-D-alanine carboxypeptidase
MNKKRIITILRIIMPIVGIITIILFAPLDAIGAWIVPLPDTVQEQVDDAINHELDGLIVYVDQAGEQAYYAAGWKNKGSEVPADPQALFKIASISKLYMATAAAKLANSGDLSLDASLADYLPELDGKIENADRITVRMLVQHRSGIPDFIDQSGFDWFVPHTDIDKTLAMVFDQPAEFEPDARYKYSNTNYLLLGKILDKVLGYNHAQYIDDEILTPLGLTNTYYLPAQAPYDDIVSGYWVGYEDDLRSLTFDIPGGSMVASAEDVGIFLRALNNGSLLDDDEQAIYSSIYEYEHTGWLPGYYSIARYHPETDTVVIQFVNTTGDNAILTVDVVYKRIVKILGRE